MKGEYTLDAIHSDIIHLGHLIDETMTKLLEVDHHTLTPDTKHYIDRASAFTWVARDLVERIEAGFPGARRADRSHAKENAHA
ncbi:MULTISPECIES: hypothetical protein [unclassified Rhizobium]|uniref:hypothetical protein n=1 Tax=unclassified Rhizobium TaxID=2613769 RepID=UPI0016111BEF|nr:MULTISPECIES: hypothetical protein [unclassified Rhizobium]MBB3385517.1 hypothetical protein [Rhizobium sp. BK098]MBB3617222.1 hypothetical protein [Rhizobium sp. BK609]MBB3682942.1 hypothetical protein [Rhizobium sp. BK612]